MLPPRIIGMIVIILGKKLQKSPVSNVMDRQNHFEVLVKAYSSDLYRFAFWLCQHHAIADDLVQDTFLRAWKALDSLEDEKKAKAWLITILRRENARRFERKQLDLVDIEEVLVEDQHNPGPEQSLDKQQLYNAIGNLEMDYHEPLLLQVLGGFKTSEIAEILELNLNTVNARLFRARDHLRTVLHKAWQLGESATH